MPNVFRPPHGPCFPDLSGQIALVTGGGTGIGRGISIRLAEERMRLFLCGIHEEPLVDVAREIEAGGGTATPIVCDISKPEEIEAMFATIRSSCEGPDVLVHNAAMMTGRGKILDTDVEFWRQMFATNVESAFVLSRECAKTMIPRHLGSIVFISTIGAQRAHYGLIPYDSSKGAIDSLTRAVALELGEHNIRVNGVAPGPIPGRSAYQGDHTPRPMDVLAFQDEIPFEDFKQPYIPLGRHGTPAEIASVVAFLASAQASYVTGQIIAVDGGATAQLSPKGIWI